MAEPAREKVQHWLHALDLGLITLALGLEAAAGALFYDVVMEQAGESSRAWTPLLHVFASLMTALTARGVSGLPTLCTALFLPPVGVIARFLDLWLREAHRARTRFPLYEHWLSVNQHEAPEPGRAPLQGPDWIWSDAPLPQLPSVLGLAPVSSLLNHAGASSEVKFEALRRLTELRPEDSVPLMKQALASEDPAARYYAARLLANLEDLYSRRIGELSGGQRLPEDVAEVDELAFTLLEYAGCGVLDPGEARRHRAWAVEALFSTQPMSPHRPRRVQLALAHALLELGQAQEAGSIAVTLLERNPTDQTAYRLLLECCLRQGDHEGFRRWVRQLLAGQPEAYWARELAERWKTRTSV